MKKLTLLLIMLIPVMVFSQGYTGDYFKARNFVQAPMFRTATDTVYRLGGMKVDSIYIKGEGVWYKTLSSAWTTAGSDIYYNTGNVGIGDANPTSTLDVKGTTTITMTESNNAFRLYDQANGYDYLTANILDNEIVIDSSGQINIAIGKNNPVYKLDVNGIIGGANIETNETSLSTKLGYEAGLNENESAARYNLINGYRAGYLNTTGERNVFVGYFSGRTNTTGNYNTFLGSNTGELTASNYNTLIGGKAGNSLETGSGNVFIGYSAGSYTTKSNRLIIHSLDNGSEAADSTKSIIYGVMSATTANQSLTINAKLKVDMPHAAIYRNTDLTISASQNIWYKVTGFTSKDADMMTVAGDSIQLTVAGHYIVNVNASFSGSNNEVWELGIFKNNTLEEPSQLRYTSTADVGNMSCPVYVSSDGDDWVSFRIRNTTDNDDPTIKRFSTIISTIHLTK